MKKKIFACFIVVALIFSTMTLAACDDSSSQNSTHTHTFSQTWTYDETHHWHAATCEHTEEVSGRAEHTFGIDNECDDCGYLTVSQGISFSLSSDETYYIVSGIGTCTDTELVIPSTYEDKEVKTIGEGAFDCCALTSVIIPDNVTTIGDDAFGFCPLKNITIPEKVISIGDDAFYGCSMLIEVYNKSNLTITAGGEDNGCVGYYAKNVYTPTSGASKLMTDNNGFVFYADDGTSEYYLMDYVGNETDIVLPDSINGCSYHIYRDAFCGKKFLINITIPDSVLSIGNEAFYGCISLINVTIGDDVVSIGNSAFSGCSSLTNIIIHGNLTSMGDDMFSNCTLLTRIDFMGTVAEWNAIPKDATWNFDVPSTLTIYCTDGSIAKDGTVTYYDAE